MVPITIGTDPELFLKDQNGLFVSAHDLIPGSKIDPYPVPFGAIQPDGVAAEFNTAPASSSIEFIDNIDKVIQSLTAQFKSIRPDLSIAITPTATFDKAYFDGLPEKATLLGCTPDFNAYTGEENDPPSTDEPFRTGSGHVHVGFGDGFTVGDYEHFERCCELVQQLDTVLYFSSLIWDEDDKRRSLYGKIGAFRPKSYGVEYRPMSNMYLSHKAIQRFVFDATYSCSDLYLNKQKRLYDDLWAKEMVSDVRAGKMISFMTVDEYLRHMHTTYAVPYIGDYIEV